MQFGVGNSPEPNMHMNFTEKKHLLLQAARAASRRGAAMLSLGRPCPKSEASRCSCTQNMCVYIHTDTRMCIYIYTYVYVYADM